jgi:hypothetical protein
VKWKNKPAPFCLEKLPLEKFTRLMVFIVFLNTVELIEGSNFHETFHSPKIVGLKKPEKAQTPYSDKRCLNSVFSSTARSIGQQIKYTHLAEGFTIPTIKKAFDLLGLAQVIRKVSSSSPAGLPLGASASERKFKAHLVDVGLMQHLCGMPIDIEYNREERSTGCGPPDPVCRLPTY